MLLEGPQQTTGSIGQTWKTGNGRSRLVLTGQHKHTPPPHQGNQGGGRNNKGHTTPPHQGGGNPAPSTTPRPLCRPPPTHPHPRNKRRRGAGKTTTTHNTTEQHPTKGNTRTRTTHPTTRLGGHSGEATPGPIPNPEAKTPSANGTAPARTRKSRTPPSTHHPPTTHTKRRPGGKQTTARRTL